MLDHATARKHATAGYASAFGHLPSLPVVQILQAVGALETGYGTGWKGAGVGSFNMGAIITGGNWRGDSFQYTDTYPDENGVDHEYVTGFRKYPTAAEGWADLARIMYVDRPTVLAAAKAGDTYGVSAAMYETVYYRGRGKTAAERIGGHHAALMRNLVAQCKALGEQLPSGEDLPPPTLQRGATGEDVKVLQRWAGLAADGIFGPVVETWVKAFQAERGLAADGVVGPKTWAELQAVFQPAAEDDLRTMLLNLQQHATDFRGHLDQFIEVACAEGKAG